MTLIELLQCGWLGFPTVGHCYDHVMGHHYAYFITENIKEEIDTLNKEILDNLGDDWDTYSTYEAADILGYDLVGYFKYLDIKLEQDNIALQKFGALKDKLRNGN
jgi:hypothetical protein